jgi:hypothetical protein
LKKIILLAFAVASFGVTVFPADRHIAFERKDAVYIANLDGRNEKKIADGIFPAISPDGTRIAFNITNFPFDRCDPPGHPANPHQEHMFRRITFCMAASLTVLAVANAAEAPKKETQPKEGQPGSTAYLDSLDGFRGVKFGTDFSKFSDLTLDQDHGKLKFYTKKGEDYRLGLATLTTIVYHFFDGKFYGVSLHTSDMTNTKTLLAIASAAFGGGEKQDEANSIWQGQICWAHFSENFATNEGTLFIGNEELSRQLGDYEQKAANDAASQL